MNQQWNFLEKKILRAAKKRNEIAVQQLRKAVDNLYPNRSLQERVFNIVPVSMKYGSAVHGHARPGRRDRRIRSSDHCDMRTSVRSRRPHGTWML